MAREEGVASLFRGVGPNVNRAVLITSSQCVSYDGFNQVLSKQGMNEGLSLHFSSSLLAVSTLKTSIKKHTHLTLL
jgi:dicarboxylate transporter 10